MLLQKIRFLETPLSWCKVTQPFGVNYVDFYKQFGLDGHNGLDFKAPNFTPILAAHKGVVRFAGDSGGYGINILLEDEHLGEIYQTIYSHLQDFKVSEGDHVSSGEVIGRADNTGKYTTGSHLHFGLRFLKQDKTIINRGNGYRGWVDPSPHFIDRGWNLMPVDKRYLRFYSPENPGWRPWHAFVSEVKVMIALSKKLGHLPNHQQIKACTYGAWDWEAVANPSLWPIWATLRKEEYLAGKKPPIRLST